MIADVDHISRMLSDIGPELEAQEVVAYPREESWAIAFGDDAEDCITLRRDAASRKLFFFCELRPVPAETKLADYVFLLRYNLASCETGGVRMGVDPEKQCIVQIYDMPLAEVQPDTLTVVLKNFISLVRVMRMVLASGVGEQDAVDTLLHVAKHMRDVEPA